MLSLVVYKDKTNDGTELFASAVFENSILNIFLVKEIEYVTCNHDDKYVMYLKKDDYLKCLTITPIDSKQHLFLLESKILVSNCDALTQ